MRNNEKLINEIKARLRYEPETGKCFWIAENIHHPRLTGKEAGSVRKRARGDRHYIKIDGYPVPRARVAFVLMTGKFPKIADHINGDTLDDRWTNLRDVTHTQNTWNSAKTKPNKRSGLPKGIRQLGNRFQARIAVNGATMYLGTFGSIDEAAKAYASAEQQLRGEFARES
mgnify:FL=1